MNTSIKTGLFALSVLLLSAMPASAQAEETREELIASLLEQVQRLQSIVVQRESFAETGTTTEGAQDYFYFETLPESVTSAFGNDLVELRLKTDLDVLQLLVVTDCDAADTRVFDWETCSPSTWVMGSDKEEWTQTFTIPVGFGESEDQIESTIDVYACRYNGCMFEETVAVEYKNTMTFADEVSIIDRYEWEFESGNETINTQEVLLSFPHDDVKRLILDVTCDYRGLSVRTYDDNSVSCNETVTYTTSDYQDVETDDAGNTYNLALFSLTSDITEEQSGGVLLEFDFYDNANQLIASVSHRPVQKEEVEETEEETEE